MLAFVRRVWAWFTRFVPTPRLALWLAIAGLGYLLPAPAGSIVGTLAVAIVCALGVSDLLRLPPRSAIGVDRSAPASLGVGDRAAAVTTLTSRWPRRVTVTLADRLPPAVGGTGRVTEQQTTLDALATRAQEHALTGRVRGPARLGDLGLRLHGALGLVDATYRVPSPDAVVDVVPSLAQVRRFRLLAVQRRLRDVGVRPIRRRGEGLAFDTLRDYVPGDDPRHIDWKASARRSTAQVRTYTVEQGQSVVLAIDAGRLMTQIAGDRTRFEFAIEAALVLADVAIQGRDKVGLLLFDDEVRAWLPPTGGLPTLRRMREVLAASEARLVEPDYALAFRTLAQRQRTRALVICLSDVIDARASRAVLAHARHAALRHVAVFLALQNEDLVAAAHPATTASSDAWRGAAAEELLGAREQALHRMRQHGVQVLDVPPHAMTAALVNRYLSVKARGEL
jgi:uncharacterized protein (DUF58 family)